MASLLDNISLRGLLGDAALYGSAIPAINTLLTSKTPGMTPQAVDQFIAQSQSGLGDLQNYLGQLSSPESVQRRTSGSQSAIQKKKDLAESGLGVKSSFEAAKMGAGNRFNEAQRLIAQSFNRRGIRPGSGLAIEPMEQAAVDYAFNVANLDANRDKELRAEQERIADLMKTESEVPESDFYQFIAPLLQAKLNAASPSAGANMAQSGQNMKILADALEKQAAAALLGQIATRGSQGGGSGGGIGDMNLGQIASLFGLGGDSGQSGGSGGGGSLSGLLGTGAGGAGGLASLFSSLGASPEYASGSPAYQNALFQALTSDPSAIPPVSSFGGFSGAAASPGLSGLSASDFLANANPADLGLSAAGSGTGGAGTGGFNLGSFGTLAGNALGGFGGNLGANAVEIGGDRSSSQSTNANIGGTIGGVAGSFFGPLGAAGGAFLGNTIGGLFGPDDREPSYPGGIQAVRSDIEGLARQALANRGVQGQLDSEVLPRVANLAVQEIGSDNLEDWQAFFNSGRLDEITDRVLQELPPKPFDATGDELTSEYIQAVGRGDNDRAQNLLERMRAQGITPPSAQAPNFSQVSASTGDPERDHILSEFNQALERGDQARAFDLTRRFPQYF